MTRRMYAFWMMAAMAVGSMTARADELPEQRASASSQTAGRCASIDFHVVLAPQEAALHRVVGTLCTPGAISERTLQLLLSGATYDRTYWDFDDGASYVEAQVGAGFATLSLDRIGTGESDHPAAERVTVRSNAYVVHQIVQALRGGALRSVALGAVDPGRIVLVGHSLGSAVASVESSTYEDVDGVILSGVLHAQGPAASAFGEALVPAVGLPPGYLTTAPGARTLFYDAESVSDAVLAGDERTKSTVTTGELSDLAGAAMATTQLQVPVLVAVGDRDRTYCDDPSCTASGALARERSFYPSEGCVTIVAFPRTGHALNLHGAAKDWYEVAARWIAQRVGVRRSKR